MSIKELREIEEKVAQMLKEETSKDNERAAILLEIQKSLEERRELLARLNSEKAERADKIRRKKEMLEKAKKMVGEAEKKEIEKKKTELTREYKKVVNNVNTLELSLSSNMPETVKKIKEMGREAQAYGFCNLHSAIKEHVLSHLRLYAVEINRDKKSLRLDRLIDFAKKIGASLWELSKMYRSRRKRREFWISTYFEEIFEKFGHHFLGSFETNRLDKPEWYLEYIRKELGEFEEILKILSEIEEAEKYPKKRASAQPEAEDSSSAETAAEDIETEREKRTRLANERGTPRTSDSEYESETGSECESDRSSSADNRCGDECGGRCGGECGGKCNEECNEDPNNNSFNEPEDSSDQFAAAEANPGLTAEYYAELIDMVMSQIVVRKFKECMNTKSKQRKSLVLHHSEELREFLLFLKNRYGYSKGVELDQEDRDEIQTMFTVQYSKELEQILTRKYSEWSDGAKTLLRRVFAECVALHAVHPDVHNALLVGTVKKYLSALSVFLNSFMYQKEEEHGILAHFIEEMFSLEEELVEIENDLGVAVGEVVILDTLNVSSYKASFLSILGRIVEEMSQKALAPLLQYRFAEEKERKEMLEKMEGSVEKLLEISKNKHTLDFVRREVEKAADLYISEKIMGAQIEDEHDAKKIREILQPVQRFLKEDADERNTLPLVQEKLKNLEIQMEASSQEDN